MKDITEAVVRHFGVSAATVVEIVEADPPCKAKGGVLFSERRP